MVLFSLLSVWVGCLIWGRVWCGVVVGFFDVGRIGV